MLGLDELIFGVATVETDELDVLGTIVKQKCWLGFNTHLLFDCEHLLNVGNLYPSTLEYYLGDLALHLLYALIFIYNLIWRSTRKLLVRHLLDSQWFHLSRWGLTTLFEFEHGQATHALARLNRNVEASLQSIDRNTFWITCIHVVILVAKHI